MDDLRSVEQYFAQFVAPMYNFNAIQSLLRLLMLSHKAHSSMLKSVLCLMKHQLNPHPEQGMMWRPSLCLLTPPLNMMIPPFVPALNSQLVLQPGSHAIVASQPGNKVLFWLKLTNVSNPENQVIFPLRYDGDSNEIQVFIANPGLFAQQQQTNNLQFVLINNVNNILKRQITAYQAVNECCMWPAIRDLSKNLELPSN
uniref:Major sperm protein n=1 Tax=Romanomermis culicivorax TaxID=13658 RepID=A0A915ITC0_ROMCU